MKRDQRIELTIELNFKVSPAGRPLVVGPVGAARVSAVKQVRAQLDAARERLVPSQIFRN